jgi:pyruvate dehydrogenase complex dehydrogenase (E1) component
VVVGVLSALHAAGEIEADQVEAAIKRYDVDPDTIDPYVV